MYTLAAFAFQWIKTHHALQEQRCSLKGNSSIVKPGPYVHIFWYVNDWWVQKCRSVYLCGQVSSLFHQSVSTKNTCLCHWQAQIVNLSVWPYHFLFYQKQLLCCSHPIHQMSFMCLYFHGWLFTFTPWSLGFNFIFLTCCRCWVRLRWGGIYPSNTDLSVSL